MGKIYISGKMGEKSLSEATRDKFAQAEERLKAEGWDPINPATDEYQDVMRVVLAEACEDWEDADIEGEWNEYAEMLMHDLRIISLCDALYMLADWKQSPGATAEHAYAKALGKEIRYEVEVMDGENGLVADLQRILNELKAKGRTVFAWSAIKERLQALSVVVLLAVAVLLGSCTTTKYVEVPKVHTDTLYVSKMQKDSIYLHDSIFVNQWKSGDTIYQTRDRWRTEWRDRLVTDTVLHLVRDTVPKPYPVIQEKKVEKALTWWQRFRMLLGDIAIIIVGFCGVGLIVKEIILRSARG